MQRQFLLVLILLLAVASPAAANRVALLIGNAKYQHEIALANPINDVRLLAAVFRDDLKFDIVETLENADQRSLSKAVSRFGEKASGAEVAVIYYSGHGMQSNKRQNYLIPVDSKIEDEHDLEASAILADKLVEAVSAAGIKLVILDACRDAPYSYRKKGGAKGLVRMNTEEKGLLIAYATEEGRTAVDGKGRNSPYAKALAANLKLTTLPILEMFDNVADEVSSEVRGQNPTRMGNLKVKTYLVSRIFRQNRPEMALSPVHATNPNDNAAEKWIYFLQPGAFREQSDAAEMRARLAKIGFDAAITERTTDNGVLFRVRLGPYSSVETMNVVRAKLIKKGIDTAIVHNQK
jgi:uncharacterized caspase-like protein